MEKKISEFQDITPAQFTADDFWFYIQSLDGCEDYRIAKSVLIGIALGVPTTEKAITAFAGGGQGSARTLTARYNRVDTCATNADSVIPAVAATVGFRQTVQNKGVAECEYFPQVGENFLGQAVNLPVTIAPGNQASVICYEVGVLTLI